MNEHTTGCILVSQNDLFGGRMLPIVSALRIGNDYDIPVKVFWPIPKVGDYNISEYKEVFGADFLKKHFITADEYKTLSRSAVAIGLLSSQTGHELAEKVNNGQILAMGMTSGITVLKGEVSEEIAHKYRTTMADIQYTPEVVNYITKIDRVINGKQALAYHVRHGDVTTTYRPRNKPWPNKFVPCEVYAEHMKLNGGATDAPVILFGDFPQSLDWIKAKYPPLLFLKDLITIEDVGSLQLDFLDLYAMSQCSKIIAPEMSGFSRLAANIGGSRFLDIMEDLPEANMDKALAALLGRIEVSPESFSSDAEIAQCLAHLAPHYVLAGKSDQVSAVLKKELDRGNTTAFLFGLAAKIYSDAGDTEQVFDIREKSRLAPVYGLNVLAEVDAIAGLAAVHTEDNERAVQMLSIAVYAHPGARGVATLFDKLATENLCPEGAFYPYDSDLMKALGPKMLQGRAAPRWDYRMFAWEWRAFLSGTFGRMLTHAGAANTLSLSLEGIQNDDTVSSRLRVSAKSFQSLILTEDKDFERAFQYSSEAVGEFPDDPMILQRHVLYLRSQRQYDQALEYVQHLVELKPDTPVYHGLQGDILTMLRRPEEAAEAFAYVRDSATEYPGFSLRHAQVLRQLKRLDEARAVLQKSLTETGWTDAFLAAHVGISLQLGNSGELLPLLEELATEGKEVRRVHHLIAQIKQRQGDIDGAVIAAERALAYIPNANQYKVLLAEIYAKMQRIDEALTLIETLPDSPNKARLLVKYGG